MRCLPPDSFPSESSQAVGRGMDRGKLLRALNHPYGEIEEPSPEIGRQGRSVLNFGPHLATHETAWRLQALAGQVRIRHRQARVHEPH
jgi:hypothetical protein